MRVLLVSATMLEVLPTIAANIPSASEVSGFGAAGTLLTGKGLDCLITGLGQMQCGIHLTALLARERYDLVVQAGIAGSFTDRFPKRSIAVVSQESLADLGAEDNGGFLDLMEMGLLDPNQVPFSQGRLIAPELPIKALSALPRASSVTVNRVLSSESSIAWVRERYVPELVNMEGAALFYACLLKNVPFVSLRSVSDMVGARDKGSWDIPGAVAVLNATLGVLLEESMS